MIQILLEFLFLIIIILITAFLVLRYSEELDAVMDWYCKLARKGKK